jgi:predicted GIY-YIG superfamily endonuclease
VKVKGNRGYVYLIHFDAPIGTSRHSAQHYVGWALDPHERLTAHTLGYGAKITRYASKVARVGMMLAAAEIGSRYDERRVKRSHRHADYCPMCCARPRRLVRW